MADNKNDDWEDIPLDQETDDWEDVPVESNKLNNIFNKLADSGSAFVDDITSVGAPIVEGALDFSKGVAKGATMNTLDEIGGALSAGLEKGAGLLGLGPSAVDRQLEQQGFNVEGSDFSDVYRDYQQASEQDMAKSAERSPVLDVLGQIGGGMASGHIASGLIGAGKAAQGVQSISDIAKNQGKAKAALELLKRSPKEYAKMAPIIAGEAISSSEHQLIGDEADPTAVAGDVAGALAFGVPAMLGMQAAGEIALPSAQKKVSELTKKAADMFDDVDSPRLRQMKKSFQEYGQNLKIHPRSHAADISDTMATPFSQRDQKNTLGVMKTLNDADTQLGREVGNSIVQSTQNGTLVDINQSVNDAANRVAQLAQQLPSLADSRKSAQAYDKILGGQTQLTPQELKYLIDDIDASIGVFKAATNKTAADASTMGELIKFRRDISDTLKKSVPEYRLAAERFENFRNVLEQIISGGKPLEATDKFYGKLRDADNKLYTSLEGMIQNVQRDDQSAQQYRTSFTNMMKALQDFETKEVSRMASNPNLKQVLPNSKQLRNFVLDASDDSVLRGSVRRTNADRALVPDVKEFLIGKAPTSGAYMAGRIVSAPKTQQVVSASKKIYNAPTETLQGLASKLQASKFKTLGDSLEKSLKSGDSGKRNAILFTIMQNPEARLFVDGDDLTEDKVK